MVLLGRFSNDLVYMRFCWDLLDLLLLLNLVVSCGVEIELMQWMCLCGF